MRYGAVAGRANGSKCHWCGIDAPIYWQRLNSGAPSCYVAFGHEIDHLVPLVDGGSNELGNLVLACLKCNRSRYSRKAA
jgi:5-methylcytosine-specific restriction endonuclease McrA